MKLTFLLLLLCATAPTAWGWSNHTVGSYLALQELPALRDAPPVEVEPLERFLAEQYPAVVALLEQQENFAREHFTQYPPRPDHLKLPAVPSDNLRHDFLTALRLNPRIHLAMVIQPLPGQDLPEREHLSADQVMVEQTLSPWNRQRFIRVADGEKVAALAVLASAADEPDYGHDINLFSDNPGEVGALYGFGPQPFGDARFQYSSQAPFHMGFFHESAVVYAAAGFLQRSWPDWRAYQYLGLARLAFASGHPYWGYRFLGWGVHHVQDLTQPYHAKPLPGVELPSLLLLEGKALAVLPMIKKPRSSASPPATWKSRSINRPGCVACCAPVRRIRCSRPTPMWRRTNSIRRTRWTTCATWSAPSRSRTRRRSMKPSASGWRRLR